MNNIFNKNIIKLNGDKLTYDVLVPPLAGYQVTIFPTNENPITVTVGLKNIEEDNYSKAIAFIRKVLHRGCSLIEGRDCLCCEARDVLEQLGEIEKRK